MSEDSRRWLVAQGGRQEGPFTTDELLTAIRSGRVAPEAHAWNEGMAAWAPLREIPEAKAALGARGLDGMPTRQLMMLGGLSLGSGMLLFLSNIVRAASGQHVSGIWGGIAGAVMAPGILMLWKAFRRRR